MTNQPYSQPPPVPKNNNSSKFGYIGFRLSILGLFFALLCCFGGLYSYPGVLIMWILGFILSLSGFVLSLVGAFKPLRQFAIAGLVISSVGLLASLLFIGFAGTDRKSTRLNSSQRVELQLQRILLGRSERKQRLQQISLQIALLCWKRYPIQILVE